MAMNEAEQAIAEPGEQVNIRSNEAVIGDEFQFSHKLRLINGAQIPESMANAWRTILTEAELNTVQYFLLPARRKHE